MSVFLGLDTSNYTTSAAIYDTETGEIVQAKKLLPVKPGEKGLRQSDAVFHHTVQLPEVLAELQLPALSGIGVSVRPRNTEGSYMPCFLCGEGTAKMLGQALQIPVYQTSHQTGHILAALYAAKKLDWKNREFLAFHVSGGTTDCIRCTPDPELVLRIAPVSASSDLKAGQAIDRVGLMLGMQFPCGPELERLAMQSDTNAHMRVTLKDGCCSLSGLQNQCEAMHRKGAAPAEIARYCLNSVAAVLLAMTKDAIEKNGAVPVLYAGGVLSDQLIQNTLRQLPLQTAFAAPVFSSDNAAGTAIFAARKEMRKCQF